MSTPVNNADGSQLTNIPDGQTDTSTPLTLFGLGADPFVESLNEDLLHIAQCFSGANAPNNPFVGLIWHNTTDNTWSGWDGGVWVPLGAGSVDVQGILDTSNAVTAAAIQTWTSTYGEVQAEVLALFDQSNAIVSVALGNISAAQAEVNAVYQLTLDAQAATQEAATDAQNILQTAIANALSTANGVAAGIANATLVYSNQANGYAIAAQASALAAQNADANALVASSQAAFSAQNANSANSGAATFSIIASQAATNANNAASAAATSATQAGTYASNAISEAFVAQQSALNANTAAAQAGVYSNSSATSATLANSSAAAASTEAGIAVTAASNASAFSSSAHVYANSAAAASQTANSAQAAALASQGIAANASTAASNAANAAILANTNAQISLTQAITANTNAWGAESLASTYSITASNSSFAANNAANTATAAAANAASSAGAALVDAGYAYSNATQAAANATAAHTSQINATANAAAALSSATAAGVSAQQASSSSNASAASASISSGYAANASTSAAQALGYELSAQSASQTANAAAAQSSISAGTAVGAANNANAAATQAATYEGQASSFASNAAGSASSASISAGTSAASAGTAQAASNNANTAAGQANTYQGQAATYASQASGSATNAAGSASTASTQAGVATSAGTAAVTAAAITLPSTFAQGGQFWTSNPGVFVNPGALGGSGITFPTVAGIGVVAQIAALDINIASLGYLPLATGHTYNTTAVWRITVNGSSANPAQYCGVMCYDSNGTYLGAYGTDQNTSSTASSGVITIGAAGNLATATILSVSQLSTTAYIRPYVSINGNSTSATVQVYSLALTDVTAQVAAAASASASATSATNAASSATAAGSSATVATNQATTATTAAGTATTQAGSAATSATNAYNDAVSAGTYAQLSATTSGALNRNPTFIGYVTNGLPPGWGDWSAGSTGLVEGGLSGVGTAYRASVAASGSQGLYQSVYLNASGYYFLEATVWLSSGDMSGAGVYFDGCSTPLAFAVDPDISTATGAGGPGIRSYSKLIQAPASGNVNLYLMTGWQGGSLGAVTAKTLDWYKCSIRPASAAEIAVGKVGTSPTALTSAISTAANTYASPLATTATSVTKLQSQINGGFNLLPNSNFEQGLTNGWTFQVYAGAATIGYVYNDGNWGALGFIGYSATANSVFGITSQPISIYAGQTYTLSGNIQAPGGGSCYMDRLYFNSSGTEILDGAQSIGAWGLTPGGGYSYTYAEVAPANATTCQVRVVFNMPNNSTQANGYAQRLKLEVGSVATPYSADATVQTVAQTTATLQQQTATYIEQVSTSGGTSLVELVSSSTGGTNIQLISDKVYLGPSIYATSGSGTLTVGSIVIDGPNNRIVF